MKVILVNGSPHNKGCTYTALSEVAGALEDQGVETEIFHIGAKPVAGCMACGQCAKLGRCVIDDVVNEFVTKAQETDGFVFGSPVYYASMNGSMVSFMDRTFFSGTGLGVFRCKPAASVVNARRGGNTATFDQMNKYYTIAEMPVVSSTYWNMTHGNKPEQTLQDAEGIQTMRVLGRNMAWLLQCLEAGCAAGIETPAPPELVHTNFIR